MRIVGRRKVTVSLSSRCLELIDQYAQTTGFESKSRVIEEAVFAISELQKYRRFYGEKFRQSKPNPSSEETLGKVMDLADILSKFAGVLDRFDRFS